MNESLSQLYEDLKLIAYRSEHIRNSFLNGCVAKTEAQKEAVSHIDEQIKTITADTIIALEFIYQLAQCEEDTELQSLLEQAKETEVIE